MVEYYHAEIGLTTWLVRIAPRRTEIVSLADWRRPSLTSKPTQPGGIAALMGASAAQFTRVDSTWYSAVLAAQVEAMTITHIE